MGLNIKPQKQSINSNSDKIDYLVFLYKIFFEQQLHNEKNRYYNTNLYLISKVIFILT